MTPHITPEQEDKELAEKVIVGHGFGFLRQHLDHAASLITTARAKDRERIRELEANYTLAHESLGKYVSDYGDTIKRIAALEKVLSEQNEQWRFIQYSTTSDKHFEIAKKMQAAIQEVLKHE